MPSDAEATLPRGPRQDAPPPSLTGLNEADAAARLATDGQNVLPGSDSRGLVQIAVEVLREPMFAMLLAGGLVYLIVGELTDALVLLAFASVSVIIAVVQEYRSERVLAALKALTTPSVTVIREGRDRRIASTELVRGDLYRLAEGERLAADGILRSGREVELDESLLTGEPVPVSKAPDPQQVYQPDGQSAPPGGDGGPFLFAGTLVVRGQGLAEVTATGRRTEIGRIGTTVNSIETRPTRLTRETRQVVRRVGGGAMLICAIVVMVFGLVRGSWLQGWLSGIALAMAMLPEEFPLVLTVFMVMGAWRISQAGVLTRRASAIETLGSASVLCTDKTGTLTENRMRIVKVWTPATRDTTVAPTTEAAYSVISHGILASAQEPFDPMERAFHDTGAEIRVETGSDNGAGLTPAPKLKLLIGWGLTPDRLAVTQIWRADDAAEAVVAVKGAPETLIRLCGLDDDGARAVQAATDVLAKDGLRVLAVARGCWREDALPASPDALELELLGLVGLEDPLRRDVPDAIAECRTAGVRVVMITGDHAATAQTIAQRAGIDTGDCLAGVELDALTDAQLAERIADVSVFARVLPTQKLRIVRALQATGAVVAMTGDGVNDAPALKAADIGIAMGLRGSDVAREAASLVLMQDDFGSIVKTMRLGRRIYDNLRKAMGFIISVHVPIAGLALLPLLTGEQIILAPAHIAFLEMVIDPTCSIAFEAEPEEPGLMRRPPRHLDEPLFYRGWVLFSLARGTAVLIVVIGIHEIAGRSGLTTDQSRSATFVALVLSMLALLETSRRFREPQFRQSPAAARPGRTGARNGPALAIMLVVICCTAVAALVHPAEQLFGFGELSRFGVLLALGGAGLSYLVLATGLGHPSQARSEQKQG